MLERFGKESGITEYHSLKGQTTGTNKRNYNVEFSSNHTNHKPKESASTVEKMVSQQLTLERTMEEPIQFASKNCYQFVGASYS